MYGIVDIRLITVHIAICYRETAPNVPRLQNTGSKPPRILFEIPAVNAAEDIFSLPAVHGAGPGKLSNNHLNTALLCYCL